MTFVQKKRSCLTLMKLTAGVNLINSLLEPFFVQKVLCTAFLYLHFDFIIFWCKTIGPKASHKMLIKLSTGVNIL